MVDLPRAELAHKLLGSEALEVGQEELPQLEDVVPCEIPTLLDEHGPGSQELCFDCRPEPDRAAPDNEDATALRISASVRFLLGLHSYEMTKKEVKKKHFSAANKTSLREIKLEAML